MYQKPHHQITHDDKCLCLLQAGNPGIMSGRTKFFAFWAHGTGDGMNKFIWIQHEGLRAGDLDPNMSSELQGSIEFRI